MSWFAVGGVVVSAAGSYMGAEGQKKAAKAQMAMSRRQAEELRQRSVEAGRASKAEIETLRTLRSLDLPALQQANQTAAINAGRSADRVTRMREVARMPDNVREAVFGGQFREYLGRQQARVQHHIGLTKEILAATERQQERALGTEQTITGINLQGEQAAINLRLQADQQTASILGAVGQAAGQYGAQQSADTRRREERTAQQAQFQEFLQMLFQNGQGGGQQ